MAEEKKVLDLDELFGEARAVKVRFKGKEYELLRMEALGPRAILRFQGMQGKAVELQDKSLKQTLSEEDDQEIQKLFADMLQLLCKELPVHEMSFAVKTKTLEFYLHEVAGKKGMEAAMNRLTGETSSQS